MTDPGTNQNPSSPEDDNQQLDFQITTMKSDMENPYQGENLSIDLDQQKKTSPSTPSKMPEPKTTIKPSPFLSQKVSSIPDQALKRDLFVSQAASLTKEKQPAPTTTTPIQPLPPVPTVANPTPASMPSPTPTQPPAQSYSAMLIIVAVGILILTIGSGAYYYFVILNQPTEEVATPIETPAPDPGSSVEITSPEETVKPIDVNATTVALKNNDLQQTLTDLLQQVNQSGSQSTKIYKFINNQNEVMPATEVLAQLNVDLGSIEKEVVSAYVTVSKVTSESAKLGLMIQTKTDVKQQIISQESTLLERLSGLYFNEKPSFPASTSFEVSKVNPDVRFFNFVTNDPKLSLDWGVFQKENAYFILFGTSRETMQNIINALK